MPQSPSDLLGRKVPTRPSAYTRPPTMPYSSSTTDASSTNDRFRISTTYIGRPPPKAPKSTLTSSQRFSNLERNLESLAKTHKEKSTAIFAGQGEGAVTAMFKPERMPS